MSNHGHDFSMDRGGGIIQLTERQLDHLAETRHDSSSRDDGAPFSHNQNDDTQPSRSVASTTVARADQKAFLKRVLASKAKSTARSTSQSVPPLGAANNNNPHQQYHVIDQKALLKKVLSKKSQTNTTLHRDEHVESAHDNPVVSMEMKPLNRMNTCTRSGSHDDDQDDTSSSLYDSQSKKPSPERLVSKVRPRQETRESETEYSSRYIAFLDGLKKEVAGDHTEVRQNQNWWWLYRLEFLCTLIIIYIYIYHDCSSGNPFNSCFMTMSSPHSKNPRSEPNLTLRPNDN
jgi:hypothetical protein